MPLSCATILDNVSQSLQDTTPTLWPDTENLLYLPDALAFISRFVPYIAKVTFTVESRTGTATSTGTSKHLVDATNLQFLSTDVGKTIYNTTDKTWAVVTAYTSTSDITLTADIMASGEAYKMFNEDCTNAKQINISDVADHMWVDAVEYPIGTYRNWKLIGNDVLEIDLDNDPSDTSETDADKNVYVWFAKRQKLSRLTDLAGTLNGAHAAAATSIAIADFSGTEIVEAGQEFTIASVRGAYTVTAAVTLSGGGGTVVVYPGLESAGTTAAVITMKGSTLNFELESIIVDVWSGISLIKKATKYIQEINTAQANLVTGAALLNTIVKDNATARYVDYANARVALGRHGDEWTRQGKMKLADAQRRLELMASPRKHTDWSRS